MGRQDLDDGANIDLAQLQKQRWLSLGCGSHVGSSSAPQSCVVSILADASADVHVIAHVGVCAAACCPSVGSVASFRTLIEAMAEDADFEMAAALLGEPGPDIDPPDEWADVGGDFEAAVALLEDAPAAGHRPSAGFGARSPALLKFAQVVKANLALEEQQADLNKRAQQLER